jgi:hypothetical protein
VTCKPENMTDSNPTQTQHSYRLIDANGEVLDQTDLPTDGEAIAWAEEVRSRTPGLTVRRVERQDETQGWVFVSEAGTAAADE